MNGRSLGETIRRFRQKNGLTQTELAEKLSVSFQAVSNWERGITPPDLDNVCRLAELFGVSMDALVHGDGAMRPLYLAVDAGGTKTEFLVFSLQGDVLFQLCLGGANPNVIGMEACCDLLAEGIDKALSRFTEIKGLFAGVSGAGAGKNKETLQSFLSVRYPGVTCLADSDTANLWGDVPPSCRLAMIAGTGSSLFVRTEGGNKLIGGWGYMLDEAGSGFDVGRDVLRAVLDEETGYGTPTALTEKAEAVIGGKVLEHLDTVYQKGRAFIASFSPLAFSLYQTDAVAHSIICKTADRLAFMINFARQTYHTGPEVTVCGGLFEHASDILLGQMRQTVLPDTCFLTPEFPPIYGACMECCRRMGVSPDKGFREHFRKEYQRRG